MATKRQNLRTAALTLILLGFLSCFNISTFSHRIRKISNLIMLICFSQSIASGIVAILVSRNITNLKLVSRPYLGWIYMFSFWDKYESMKTKPKPGFLDDLVIPTRACLGKKRTYSHTCLSTLLFCIPMQKYHKIPHSFPVVFNTALFFCFL